MPYADPEKNRAVVSTSMTATDTSTVTVITLAARPRGVIFDMDSTLSSVVHRRHLVTEYPKDWSRFHGSMVLDAPLEHTIRKLRAHKKQGEKVIILTMRPERFRPFTERWLRQQNVPFDRLYMRPEGDFRSSDAAKLAIYREQIAPEFDVELAYDDRTDVLDMWKAIGVKAVPVSDPGLPPFEGQPVPDPKYPKGRFIPFGKYGQKSGAGGIGRVGARVYVPPHERVVAGKLVKVDGYFRKLSAIDRLLVKLSGRGRG